nr:carbonic anhydrase [Halorhodospira abdelmalekii]
MRLQQRLTPARRAEVVVAQRPFAAILSCADSRVPAEEIFDQGIGDLFIVRVAGNFAGTTQIGSLEYAVHELGVRLIVVLGHARCGAVGAALAALREHAQPPTAGLCSIVDALRPALAPLLTQPATTQRAAKACGCTVAGEEGEASSGDQADAERLVEQAVVANVHWTCRELIEQSAWLAEAQQSAGLSIVGAKYDLAQGTVTWLDAK